MKFYYDLMSEPCRAIYIFLKINNIQYEAIADVLQTGQHRTDDFAKINPFQKVPVIDDDGFILTESVAILKYLAKKHKVPDHWYPSDEKQQAKVEEYLHWQHANTRYNGNMLFHNLFLLPLVFKKPINREEVGKFRKEVEKTVSFLKSYYLRDRPFLCGSEISLADLLGVCELEELQVVCEEQLYTQNATVNDWITRVKGPHQALFDEANAKFAENKAIFLKFDSETDSA